MVLLLTVVAAGCSDRPTTHHKPGTSHEEASGTAGRLLDRKDESGHRLRQVAAQGAPSVELAVRPDSVDGWNIQLSVREFRFTPDSVGGGALPGRGHAHLYLDGRKLARVYGEWYHLPASAVPEGGHTLTARLYADDHTAWAVDGKPVEATAELAQTGKASGHDDGDGHDHEAGGSGGSDGTGGSGGSGSSGSSGGSGDPDEGSVDRTVTITVDGDEVQPPPGRIELKKGQRIRLSVTSDRADTLHVHGYDKEADLPAGRAGTLTLALDRTGLFEVETHGSGLVLTQLVVR
ncbi:hypothetical protein H9Y04_22795 [Streptomyces sp. TRM66268-LWL]|uniref:Secreted protein n=1 Tax=Streptomyces polyasparticus TaxID=2767826 RepID=A0ABR7SIP4_9ACTN|nr:hypothetical protein [Streptomyces polyasparticus]MBC9715381.1 hypothetical protein [Streptomyces polyasparticus]